MREYTEYLQRRSTPPRDLKAIISQVRSRWRLKLMLRGVVRSLGVAVALFLVAAVPALLVLPMRFLVPESKEWQHGATRARRVPLGELVRRPGWVVTIAWSSIVMVFGFGVYRYLGRRLRAGLAVSISMSFPRGACKSV